MRSGRFSRLVLVLPLVLGCGDGGDADGGTGSGTDPGTSGTGTSSTSTTTTGSSSSDAGTSGGTSVGTSGGTTAGGSSGGAGGKCTHGCTANEDCTFNGSYVGLDCIGGACEDVFPCTEDADCEAKDSGWLFEPCTMNGGECTGGKACLDLGDGAGGCAVAVNGGCPPPFVPLTRTSLDDGSNVQVCALIGGICNADIGLCHQDCNSTGCGPMATCDTETGMCQCTDDSQCAGVGGVCEDGACVAPPCTDASQCMGFFPYDGGTVSCG